MKTVDEVLTGRPPMPARESFFNVGNLKITDSGWRDAQTKDCGRALAHIVHMAADEIIRGDSDEAPELGAMIYLAYRLCADENRVVESNDEETLEFVNRNASALAKFVLYAAHPYLCIGCGV